MGIKVYALVPWEWETGGYDLLRLGFGDGLRNSVVSLNGCTLMTGERMFCSGGDIDRGVGIYDGTERVFSTRLEGRCHCVVARCSHH